VAHLPNPAPAQLDPAAPCFLWDDDAWATGPDSFTRTRMGAAGRWTPWVRLVLLALGRLPAGLSGQGLRVVVFAKRVELSTDLGRIALRVARSAYKWLRIRAGTLRS
jgi:hypothetical protein